MLKNHSEINIQATIEIDRMELQSNFDNSIHHLPKIEISSLQKEYIFPMLCL